MRACIRACMCMHACIEMCMWPVDLWTFEFIKHCAHMPEHENLVWLVCVCEYTYLQIQTHAHKLYVLEHTRTTPYLAYDIVLDIIYVCMYVYIYILGCNTRDKPKTLCLALGITSFRRLSQYTKSSRNRICFSVFVCLFQAPSGNQWTN
jgi:hypothetical protein